MTRQEGNPLLPPEAVRLVENLLLDAVGGAEDGVDLFDFSEALDARADREDVVLLARFHKERPRGDQAGNVVLVP